MLASRFIKKGQKALDSFYRLRTLRSHRISALPIVILMPHSACNCRCVMCDIWKGNKNKRELTIADIQSLLQSLRKLRTRRVLMSGGEALLNPHFFEFCKLLDNDGLKISLLSTGLTLKQHAPKIAELVNEVIVSLDGDEELHDKIRNVPGSFRKLKEGVQALKQHKPSLRVSGRCVIHRLNYMRWTSIVEAAQDLQLDSISFLPADVSSEAFNRKEPWSEQRRESVALQKEELPALSKVVDDLVRGFSPLIQTRYISENEGRLRDIEKYYRALNGLGEFPVKACNAPWVSVVVEPDGNVRPCFFHDVLGNVRTQPLEEVLNSPEAIAYRKNLDVTRNETCVRCVCSLNLRPLNHGF